MGKRKDYERKWIPIASKKPTDFRLVELLYEGMEKLYRGWWTGYQWDGARLPKGKVLCWRQLEGAHFIKKG